MQPARSHVFSVFSRSRLFSLGKNFLSRSIVFSVFSLVLAIATVVFSVIQCSRLPYHFSFTFRYIFTVVSENLGPEAIRSKMAVPPLLTTCNLVSLSTLFVGRHFVTYRSDVVSDPVRPTCYSYPGGLSLGLWQETGYNRHSSTLSLFYLS